MNKDSFVEIDNSARGRLISGHTTSSPSLAITKTNMSESKRQKTVKEIMREQKINPSNWGAISLSESNKCCELCWKNKAHALDCPTCKGEGSYPAECINPDCPCHSATPSWEEYSFAAKDCMPDEIVVPIARVRLLLDRQQAEAVALGEDMIEMIDIGKMGGGTPEEVRAEIRKQGYNGAITDYQKALKLSTKK